MSDRETSEEMGTLAARVLRGGHPLDNEQVRAVILKAVEAAIVGAGEQIPAMSEERLFRELAVVLSPYFENMLSLAGSVLAQVEPDGEKLPTAALRGILAMCAATFRDYARLHAAKLPAAQAFDPHGAEEIARKVNANARLARMCELALAGIDTGIKEEEWLPAASITSPGTVAAFLAQGGAGIVTAAPFEGPLSTEAKVMIALLKGQAPHGVGWRAVWAAGGLMPSDEFSPNRVIAGSIELVDRGLVRSEGDGDTLKVFATDAAIADPAVPAFPWPERSAP